MLGSRDFAKNKKQLHKLVEVRKHGNKRIGVAKFSNMLELVDMYKSLDDNHRSVDGKRSYDVSDDQRMRFVFGNKDTYGTSKAVAPLRTIDGIVETAQSGNCHNVFTKVIDEYRKKLETSSIGTLQDDIKSVKRVTRFTDDGGELDIDRVMCGDTDYWRSTKRNGEYRVVRLVINYGIIRLKPLWNC